eukprot:TRINITY_DN8934_c0_g1_i1.p1 TRINITY_DN8934_c0_g1~~TRINITY_DN8934_c0_g1_i1.p1  ORF type:complete len:155 (-),score=32.14 TRINITY_DN8934_c0_g1_i1:114-578(-)
MSLPAGWVEKESRSHAGKIYYYNGATGESVWEKPTSSGSASSLSEVRASHLLVKHRGSRNPSSWKEPSVTRTKEEAIEKLKKFRQMIENKEISFEELASTESHCSSAKRGGDLGPFKRGAMQKPFEDATFALKVGEMSEIVDTDSGVHIILRTA